MSDNIYSVTQVNSYIKNMFAKDSALNRIRVQGEVSNCKYHSSGHIYFTLKDSGGTLSAIMFASRRTGLSFNLRDGQKIVVTGSIEVYERGGSYQIYAQKIELAGMGDLYERFMKLKKELEEMGMFAPEYKKPIPRHPAKIGIATASTGAAVHDIINVTTRRNPYIQLVFVPTKVQGQGAAASIVRSIRMLDDYGVDVIIVGRGGGSLEDLWAFNEETVARAIFNCRTPVISAVGHETDFTIADFTADMRAPTPSAAAEIATEDMTEFLRSLDARKERLDRAVQGLITWTRDSVLQKKEQKLRDVMESRIDGLRRRTERAQYSMNLLSPANRLNAYRARAEESRMKLSHIMQSDVAGRRHDLAIRAERLKGLSPLAKISSGYAWVSDAAENHISRASHLHAGDAIKLRFADGTAGATIDEVITEVSHE
ncbi:MAG: exodeoxyribonuclease VII large subunit [Lachnospiraceae bacterium]|nr:exodeoxyribonuclease VII large subunit [Lachnospiraceae bacterium]